MRRRVGRRSGSYAPAGGIAFTLHHYEYEPTADRIGMQAAEALGSHPPKYSSEL